MDKDLTTEAKQILGYLKRTSTPCSASSIGILVGKKMPNTSSNWSTPFLQELEEQNLVTVIQNENKVMYQYCIQLDVIEVDKPKNHFAGQISDVDLTNLDEDEQLSKEYFEGLKTKQIKHPIEEPKELTLREKYKNHNINKPILDLSKKKDNFRPRICSREIKQLVSSKLENSDGITTLSTFFSKSINEWINSNGDIPEDRFQPLLKSLNLKFKKRNMGHYRLTMLDKIDKHSIIFKVEKYFEEIKKKIDPIKQPRKCKIFLNKFMNELLSEHFTSKQLRSNLIKFFIRNTTHKIVTGKEVEIKNDGREFKNGQKIIFLNKHKEEKEGMVKRVYIDKVSRQRIIKVLQIDSNVTELKVDRKILSVVA